MVETQALVLKIKEGIREKKGEKIVVVDISNIENAACAYFIICEGGSNTHVDAIADSVEDYVRKELNEAPIATDGYQNALWIALDYGDVMVHVFQREPRNYYNLESLWADGIVTYEN